MQIKKVLVTPSQRVPVNIWTEAVDDKSRAQLSSIASLPIVHHHVAAMPDVHLGIGATIGSVIAFHKGIILAAVGVDLECGMAAGSSVTAWMRRRRCLMFYRMHPIHGIVGVTHKFYVRARFRVQLKGMK